MSISGIASTSYATQIAAMQRYERTDLQQDATDLSLKNSNKSADTVEISPEAKSAQESQEKMKQLTEDAMKMLKIREVPKADIERFQEILASAEEETDAKSFLKSLSAEDRDIVKRCNSYGCDLNNQHIDGMSEEGARNMLVQPDYRCSVDFNNDGIVEHGQAMTFQFPPPNAPESVKDAWDETTANMSFEEQMKATSLFMVQSLQANVRLDANGEFQEMIEPGDPDYTNIFPTDQESWAGLLDDIDDYLDWVEDVMPSEKARVEEDRQLIDSFRKNIFE